MPKAPKVAYSEDQLQSAIKAVRENRLPVRSAAKEHGVPVSTLRFRLSEKFIKSSLGPAPILTAEEETTLVKWLLDNYKKGFPKTSLDLRLSVKEFLTENNRPNPFLNNYPGKGWLRAFFNRHPELSLRKPEAVTQTSACVSEQDNRKWFATVAEALKEEGIFEILSNPERVFNGDESSFVLCPEKNLVISLKGAKNVYDVDVGDAKAALTVMCTFSAAGKMVPPMIIYPYKRIPTEVVRNVPPAWSIGRSEKGWMTAENFYEYIGNTFNAFIESNKIERPVILFVDGHKTHLTRQTSKLCSDLKIVLIALYPNATRILQPADVALFFPMKSGWKREVVNWRKEHPLQSVTKKDVAPILEEVLKNKDFSTCCINGFKVTGLFPWNADALDFSKCLGRSNDSGRNEAEQTPEENKAQTKMLSYERFCSIVGDEKVAIFQAAHGQGLCNDEYQVLYKLWLEFQEPCYTSSTTQIPPEPTPSTSKESSTTNTVETFPEPTPSTSTSLADHLNWPEHAKRKGQRNVERMPYVISSDKYRQILDDKARKKAEEEAAKEERKRKREERREEEEKVKNKKARRSVKEIRKVKKECEKGPRR